MTVMAAAALAAGKERPAVRSMTGYAAVERSTEAGHLTASLRSVNHRGLDLHCHIGTELAAFENDARALLKRKIARAHVEVRLYLSRPARPETAYDRFALERYVTAFREAAADFGLESNPDLNVLLTLPGVLGERSRPEALPPGFSAELTAALDECADELNSFREREGEALREDIEAQADAIGVAAGAMAKLREGVLSHFEQRLRSRLAELLSPSAIPESRIAEEAAVLADKSDVQEEITRLNVHLRELRRLLDEGGAIGKRIDFLLQEMNREVNTLLSKSSSVGDVGLELTSLGLALKANIERIREQALNLE